ncbi:crossover junction endodeoxyribonuclease RuvC [Halioxenophilus aromaticivorans]|uniref:Crossover junction endodeoxyribonuclease RuvC n=1 Tax=Halioxenophilus aromaticivorans TaxID=1306992 RepID=A0AAV3TWU9_9ALTE
MPLILGVDPGSLKTGFGIVNSVSGKLTYVASGVIRLNAKDALASRLKHIFESLNQIIEEYSPQQMAVEQVFLAKNPSSALKLGQARGAAIVAAGHYGLPVAEYEARKVKQSVVGTGAADKIQVQLMIQQLLKLSDTPQEDAADALAVAVCHAHSQQFEIQTARSLRFRRGRLV